MDAYPAFIDADLHIVTPNKRANVLPWRRYESLKALLERRQKYFLLRDERRRRASRHVDAQGSDRQRRRDRQDRRILSGTLSYLFNAYDGTVPFSELLREAQKMGFTEPDPREDLSGEDVARKLLILAREIGLKMDIDQVRVHSLVPRALSGGAFSPRFFQAFARHDAEMLKRLKAAQSRGNVLRYVGGLEQGRAQAALQECPRTHPLAAAKGSDNIIAFTTERYARTPLVVQGPGAGADVTAMGVFSDILKLLHYLPE